MTKNINRYIGETETVKLMNSLVNKPPKPILFVTLLFVHPLLSHVNTSHASIHVVLVTLSF